MRKLLASLLEPLVGIRGDLGEIRDEMRKFNQTVPMLDELTERTEALRAVEEQEAARRDAGKRAWKQHQERKGKSD